MKKISILILSVILMMGVSGCMNNSDIKKTSSNELVDYMNEKYDDEFSFKAPFGGGAGASSKQIIVSSKKYPEYDIWVEYSYDDDSYNDNYTDYRFIDEYEKVLSKDISNLLNCETKVKREIATSGSYTEFANDITFDEYMNTEKQFSDFTAVIMISDSVDKKIIEDKLSLVFNKYASGFYGNIYFVDNNEDLDGFFELDITGMDEHRSVFVKKTSEEATRYEWR